MPPVTTNPLSGIDHTLIGVRDLESARATWRHLGFTVTPRGRHIGWGTGNYCVMFGDDYVELLGIVDPSQFLNRLDTLLETRGEGLLGLALEREVLGDGRGQARLAVVDVADRADVDVRLVALELLLGHLPCVSSSPL